MGHPNSKKHKANHCGYKKKPSRKEVHALLDFYDIGNTVAIILAQPGKGKPRLGTQLSLFD